ncbi:MAG: ABC transporter ATP-binding protein, partial [Pseudooceanicola sp.]|nr:ABC transporter ATP-binding protein [Pseudooceanicola sp.]
MRKTLLKIENLSLGFNQNNKYSSVLKNVSFDVFENEILGIVGESGSGKSVTNLAILGLLPKRITSI